MMPASHKCCALRASHSSTLQLLFDFVDSKGGSGMAPGSYSLVTQYPRRVFAPPAASAAAAAAAAAAGPEPTVQAAGLAGPREVLFLEPRSSSTESETGGGVTADGTAGSNGSHAPGAAQ